MSKLGEEDKYLPPKPSIFKYFQILLTQPLFEIRRVRQQGGSYTLAIPNNLHSFTKGQKVTISSMDKNQLQNLALGMDTGDKVIVIFGEGAKDEA